VPSTGVVLAGGRSSRFGGDKLAAGYRGEPLLHHAIRRLAEVCGDVVVVLAPDGPEPELPPDLSVRLARDEGEAQGPLAGLLAGLSEVPAELAVVAGGDMPELSAAVLHRMLLLAEDSGADGIVLQDGDRFRPLPAVVRTRKAREVGRALLTDGERSLRALLGSLRVVVIDEPAWRALDPEGRTLFDVDEPGDLYRGS
jgi:molybdenum cofactor guanylyltransferase